MWVPQEVHEKVVEHAAEHKETVGGFITHHIQDSHHWEPFPGLSFHLPTIHVDLFGLPLDLSITKHVLMMMIAAMVLFLAGWWAFRKKKMVYGGLGGVLESLVLFIRDEVAIPNMGQKSGAIFTPFLSTIFLFILTLNLMGIVPIFATPTGNISITVGFATITLLGILLFGMKENGILGFWASLLPHGVPWWISIILFPIEVVSIFAKAFALSVRLFANMIAGHMVIFYILGIIIIFGEFMGPAWGYGFSFVSIGLSLFIDLLEILVAFIQAYIFTILSALFLGMYMHPEH